MPNFKCQSLKPLTLPFTEQECEFKWLAKGEKSDLIFVCFKEERFFIEIKKDIKGLFIIKGEKHSKPAQIGYLQQALLYFKNNFCQGILSEAFSPKATRLVQKTPLIAADIIELLTRLKEQEKIFIEIGFGSGRHLLFQAEQNPDTLVLGIEIYTPAIEQVAKLARAKQINNILLIQSDARLLLESLDSNSLEKIFLHFPVPWDKKPHRRVISSLFAKETLRVLKPNKTFELRTDSKEYFDFALQTFLEFEKLEAKIFKNQDLSIRSKYEERWQRQNKDIFDLSITCHEKSKEKIEPQELCFDELCFTKEKLQSLKAHFSKQNFKGDDFFLHLEALYELRDGLLLKIAFGSFAKSEHNFLLLKDKINFVFPKPYNNKENTKALSLLKELLRDLSRA